MTTSRDESTAETAAESAASGDDSRLQSTRRHFLSSQAMGIGSLALAGLLNEEGLLANPSRPELEQQRFDLLPKQPPSPPQANAMISLWMQGGPSHLDLFDPKPMLQKYDGKRFPGSIKYDNAAEASPFILGSPWKFHKHGESGIELSELLPHLGEVIDDVSLIRSMHTGVNNHGQSINALNTGQILSGRPSLGSWMVYGLGCESQNLPAYVAMTDPQGVPVLGVQNWSNGWLPSLYQGTVVRPREPRILNLSAPPSLSGGAQKRYLSFVERLNREHFQRHPGELDLEARIQSYQLAARMQTSAVEALDISKETKATQQMYGIGEPKTDEYGQRCLIARRLIERGVRFIQIFTGNQTWDDHTGIITRLPRSCGKVDKPSAALVRDLKQRGLLDTTVVHWGGEMGRLPVIENNAGRAKVGRDHNTYGFSMWVAGGGFRGGYAHGATDEFGHKAVENIVHHYDYHATLLHLFGLDPAKLVYRRNGIERSLIEKQPARIVSDLLVRKPFNRPEKSATAS